MATFAEPHCYDLCAAHAARLTVPLGWEVLRLAMPSTPPKPGPDDLLALADAVREAANNAGDAPLLQRETKATLEPPAGTPVVPATGPTRRSHLRVLRD